MSYFDRALTLQYYLKDINIYLPPEMVKIIIDKTYYKYTTNITMFIYNLSDVGDGIRDGQDIISNVENYKIEFDDRYELRDKFLAIANEIYNNNVSNNPKFILSMGMGNFGKIVVIDKGPNKTLRIINDLFLEEYLISAKTSISIKYYPYNNIFLPHIS